MGERDSWLADETHDVSERVSEWQTDGWLGGDIDEGVDEREEEVKVEHEYIVEDD